MNKKAWIIILSVFLVIAGVLGGAFYIYRNYMDTNTIYTGVFIEEYDVSNMTEEEALNFLKKNKVLDDRQKSMNAKHADKTYNINLSTLGISYNYEDAVNGAYDYGRDGNVFSRYGKIKDLEKEPISINFQSEFDDELINNLVANIAEEIDETSRDATITIDRNGNISIEDGNIGSAVKREEFKDLIKNNIEDLKDIEIPMETTIPKITRQDLERINGKIGEFSTYFKGSTAGRVHNIKISAESMNNMVLMPGQDVSFNETTGPRQARYGYQEASVIVNGEFTPGMGGGVCQTSTTLYNVLLLADLTILERHPHSIAAAYVPRGQDGAVATGYLDLRFRNDFDHPIYIKAWVEGTRLTFVIYGDKNVKDYTVKIEPVLYETIPYKVQENLDENAAPGSRQLIQEGRTGYKVRTYKSKIKDGKVLERKQITSDYYRERDYIYKLGPAKIEAPAPVPPVTEVPVEEPTAPVINPDPEPIEEEEVVIPIEDLIKTEEETDNTTLGDEL